MTGGNQKSHWAISPAAYAVRDAGSGGRYAGRSSATRSRSTRTECSQPIRSAITVAGIVGYASSSSRIRGSAASVTDPFAGRSYFGGRSLATAARTVFRETPITRAITLTGIFSARCNLRISAQSSTAKHPFHPLARLEPESSGRGSKFRCHAGVSIHVPPTLWSVRGRCNLSPCILAVHKAESQAASGAVSPAGGSWSRDVQMQGPHDALSRPG